MYNFGRTNAYAYKVRRQTGDTIVEVLICIAVISTVLTGAFIVVSKSNRAIQNSAEHAQAQQRLQGELKVCALIWLPSRQQTVYQEIFV